MVFALFRAWRVAPQRDGRRHPVSWVADGMVEPRAARKRNGRGSARGWVGHPLARREQNPRHRFGKASILTSAGLLWWAPGSKQAPESSKHRCCSQRACSGELHAQNKPRMAKSIDFDVSGLALKGARHPLATRISKNRQRG